LVERRKNSIAAWKGLPVYKEFLETVESYIQQDQVCGKSFQSWQDEETIDTVSNDATRCWLQWILTVGFPSRDDSHVIETRIQKQIKDCSESLNISGLRCYVVFPPWSKLMRDPKKMKFVCSDNKLRLAKDMSNLLNAVAQIEGEVPMFVFFSCPHKEFPALDSQRDQLTTLAATGLSDYIKKFVESKAPADKTSRETFRSKWVQFASKNS
jgi:hypothetical protein